MSTRNTYFVLSCTWKLEDKSFENADIDRTRIWPPTIWEIGIKDHICQEDALCIYYLLFFLRVKANSKMFHSKGIERSLQSSKSTLSWDCHILHSEISCNCMKNTCNSITSKTRFYKLPAAWLAKKDYFYVNSNKKLLQM